MKITKKKVLLALGVLGGLVLLTAGVLDLLYGDSLAVMLANRELQGEVKAIPDTAAKDLPPLTEGDADWICWRGPKGDGASLVRNIKKDWTGGLRELWRVEYLCQGPSSGTWSAPVVRGNRLVVTGRDRNDDLVFCLSPEDGSLIWKAAHTVEAASSYGRGSRATPWIDGDRVYTFGRSGDLICWGLKDGRKLWHKTVGTEGGAESRWGHSASPLVTDALVVVPGGGTARTVAYDKKTGELRWKVGRGPAGYAGMVRMPIEGRPAVLNFHGKGLCAVDLKEGKELWDTGWETGYDVNATTPVFTGDRVFITSGYGTGCELLKVSASNAQVLWKSEVIASQHSDLHIIGGCIYGYSGDSMQNRGDFLCVELETGKELWSTGEMGWGTCVQVDGHLLCMDIKGNIFLMRPDPAKFIKVTEQRGIFGKVRGAVWTVPVLANGRLYLRFMQTLIAFDVREKS
jgi:outer membrane protein assembly factor BamB